MIANFMCDNCNHFFVCDKLNVLMKFHEDAKKDLKVAITMDECFDYDPTSDDE